MAVLSKPSVNEITEMSIAEVIDMWFERCKSLPNVGKMTHTERMLKLFDLEEADLVGAAPQLDYYQIPYAGYNFRQAWDSVQVCLDATFKQWAELRLDALWPYVDPGDYWDYLLTPEQRQTNYNMRDENSYVVFRELPYDVDRCIQLFEVDKPWEKFGWGHTVDHNGPVIDGTVEFARKLGGTVPVILGAAAPSNVAEMIPGVQNFVRWTITEPKKVHRYMELVTEFKLGDAAAVAKRKESGVPIIACVFGGARTWGPKQLAEFGKYDEMYVKEWAKHFDYVMWHHCGNNLPQIMEWFTTLPLKAIQYDESMPQLGWSWPKWVEWVARLFQGKMCAMNSPTTQMLLNGRPDEIARMIQEFIDHTTPWTTAVVMPGCEPSATTPVDNIRIMMSTARAYGKYPACKKRGRPLWQDVEFNEAVAKFKFPA